MKKDIFIMFAIKAIISLGATVETNQTLYYSPVNRGDDVKVTTTVAAKTAPLQGFGAYLNNREYYLNSAEIITSGSQADAVRTNGGNNYFYANNLKINATGSSADAINMGSNNYDTKFIDLIYVKDSADLTSKSGVTVRANNYFNENSKAVVILPDNSILKNTYANTAVNSTEAQGYTVYAGNRDKDISNLSFNEWFTQGKNNNTKGKAFVFVGDNAEIESNAKKGHAVYANKGGVIQLGDNAEITANGVDAYAIFASTEQQGTHTDNIRPGKVYLKGGAVLRAENSSHVVQAKGENSVIVSGYLTNPTIDPDTYSRGSDINIDENTINSSSGRFDILGNISAVEGGYVSLNMDDNSKFIGSTGMDSGYDSKINLKISGSGSIWEIDKDSSLTSLTLENGAVLTPFRNSSTEITSYTLTGDVKNNGGIINLSSISNNEFDVFTIDGNYHGANGYIVFDTELNNDASGTDNLIITGNTSGTTKVSVNNIGGTGAEALEGIKLISVMGNSNGEFEKDGRIVAGAYEYFLNRGDGGITDTKNWYLTSNLQPIDPPVIPPIDPPVIPPKPSIPVYRPESGSYLANAGAVNSLFIHTLHDRLGETQYTDVLNNGKKISSLWVRNVGGYSTFKDGSNQLKTRNKKNVIQVGGDIADWSSNKNNRYHLGLMAGYGFNHSKTESNKTSYTSKGEAEGFNLGIYGTYYANENDKSGFYADTWLTYSWFDNEVRGDELEKEKYKSKGITASLESGYSFKIKNNDSHRKIYYIQPKAQIIYMGVNTDNHTEANGTKVETKGDGNIQTRIGARIYANHFNSADRDNRKEIQPFVEANWIHNSRDVKISMDDVNNKIRGTKDIGEIKVGTEVKVNPNINLWGNISHQWGRNGYRDSRITIGIKYLF